MKFLLIIISVFSLSCKKRTEIYTEPKTFCIICTEQNSGTKTNEFCADSMAVYHRKGYAERNLGIGENWKCTVTVK